jgi:hypothetical protein
MSGACLCGFSSILVASNKHDNLIKQSISQRNNNQLIQDWLSIVLVNMDMEINEKFLRKLMKKAAIAHYNNLKMDTILSEYVGNLEKFISFLELQWGWKIEYDKSSKTLIADENKNYCVCPLLMHNKDINTSALCYCSEGFAEKMFSVVAGVNVSAKVISSVRRGNSSCKYKIIFKS